MKPALARTRLLLRHAAEDLRPISHRMPRPCGAGITWHEWGS